MVWYVLDAKLEQLLPVCLCQRRWMDGFLLEMPSIWDIDQQEEQRLSHSYCLDEQRNWVTGGLEAIDGKKIDAVENAKRCNVMKTNDTRLDEVIVES